MTIQMSQLFIYTPSPPTSLRHFVEFWAERYRWQNMDLYTHNIAGPHTPDGLANLFKWKIGNKLFANKLPLLKRCFIDRRAEAEKLLRELVACEHREIARRFLNHFKDGGAIWRIFWLHCWNTRFPIYDQHVHRAMTFIKDNGQTEELGKFNNAKKVQLYLDHFLPFFDEFQGMDGRTVDMALWQFGKTLSRREPRPAGTPRVPGKPKTPGAGDDRFGNRLGSQAASINAAVEDKQPVATLEAVCKATGLSEARVKSHFRWLQVHGFGKADKDGFRLIE